MKAPRCEVPGHGRMKLQKPGTPEQAFCGTWFKCEECEGAQRPGRKTIIIMSAGLKAQLAEQLAKCAPKQMEMGWRNA